MGRDIKALQKELAAFAAARDWPPYHTPKNLVMALSVEVAELMELFQWLTPEESMRLADKREQHARVEEEVADVMLYLLRFCDIVGVDPIKAAQAKIQKNAVKYPAATEGGKPARRRR
jgi:NTP pyrophosphatase (non-canonical NTP hydrolase)